MRYPPVDGLGAPGDEGDHVWVMHLLKHRVISVVERVVAHLHERQQVRCSAAGLGRSTHELSECHASVHGPRTLISVSVRAYRVVLIGLRSLDPSAEFRHAV